ncbi:MAG: MBL fold metallo-hydrolase [Chloroflexi bacterium]|nr:MBL fold metallo-hydrolase [Chloroflexota bacterium]
MYFKQILDEHNGCASYIIASRETHEAAIVDPAIDIRPYEELLDERDFTLKYVIDTHIHADHVSGARKLVAARGGELCLHEVAPVVYPFRPLEDGEELQLGQLRLRVVHTPGHRPEVISILIVNPPRSPEPSMVLTGDSLLVGDVGRPDFGGENVAGRYAADQYESLTRLLRLPDWVAVFPGHFEGPCGKGMCGRPSTTIGFERLFNPLARLDRKAFLDTVLNGVPARPLNMDAIYNTNRGVIDKPWAMLTTSPHVAEITPEALPARAANALVLDVREPDEYTGGHVPGAVNIPQSLIASRLDDLPRDRPIVTVCRSGYRAHRAAQFLKQVGYAQVENLQGGTEAWREAGRPLAFGDAGDSGDAGDTGLERRPVAETLWTHAGVLGAVQPATSAPAAGS